MLVLHRFFFYKLIYMKERSPPETNMHKYTEQVVILEGTTVFLTLAHSLFIFSTPQAKNPLSLAHVWIF